MIAANVCLRHATIKFAYLALLLFISVNFVTPAFAGIADESEMRQVAENWLTYIVAEKGDWAGDLRPEISFAEDIMVNDTLVGQYFAISSGGYILVPSLRELPPIKAYSEESILEDLYAQDGFAAMLREVLKARMDAFVDQFGSLEASQSITEPLYGIENTEAWDRFSVTAKQFAESFTKTLSSTLATAGPLLSTTWHQSSPYDALCPTGDGGQCLVGCVATAAAQIIYFHQWPPAGEGSHSYYWSGDNSCDGSSPGMTLYADFSDEYTYDHSNASVSEICYEMGVAYDMDYGVCGSGAYTLNGNYIFPAYFRYDNSAQSIYRSSYTAQNWFNVIQEQIDQYHPTLYRISGHAIVCDGWRISGTTNQVHMNYGWGGSQNAWYAVDNLHCTWSGCDPMVEGQVINIIPLSGAPWLGQNEFTDYSGGDGDGVPEAGETVEMIITINNFGGGEVTDVNASLMIDDASLTIIDGFSSLGTIPGRDSASNSMDPFSFSIPADYIPRVDSFKIELTWNGGTESDTLVVEQAIGGSTILLVDDDNLGGNEAFYITCLENFRSPYDIWTQSYYVPPDSAYMSQYDMVIWFTGDDHYAPINFAEVNAIKAFLNQGGNLVLSGQGIASFLDGFDQAFLNNYLKAEYVSTGYVPLLASTGTSELFNPGDTVVIYGTGGASNQTVPDHIQPVNGSITEVNYFGTTDAGAVSYNGGDYKLAFFGYGCEALRCDDSRFVNQDTVMSYMFEYFNYTTPETAPTLSNPNITPGDKMHLTVHTPDISWDYTDKNGYGQTMYQIQVGTNTEWSVAEMWDSDETTGSETSITYSGLELIDGTHYYVRMRAFNGSFWSGWEYTDMILNSAPAQPVAVTPALMQAATSATPVLTSSTAIDDEDDIVSYAFEIYSDAGLTALVTSTTDESSVNWQCDASLTEDNVFYWRVRADDVYETGTWSEAANFWVNAVNQLPNTFDILSPADEANLEDLQPTFVWQSTTDADPFDELSYSLNYDDNASFTSPTTIAGLTDTFFTLTEPLTMGDPVYWKVVATDGSSGETESSSTFLAQTFIPGDANGDKLINVGDAVFLINHIFNSGPAPVPELSGDANCDFALNVGDAVYLINHIFNSGPPPGCPE